MIDNKPIVLDHATITIGGREYRLVPVSDGPVDAVEFSRKSLGRKLREAREAAGLTQAQLAKRLGKSQTMIARAESGSMRVGERYVDSVVSACRGRSRRR